MFIELLRLDAGFQLIDRCADELRLHDGKDVAHDDRRDPPEERLTVPPEIW